MFLHERLDAHYFFINEKADFERKRASHVDFCSHVCGVADQHPRANDEKSWKMCYCLRCNCNIETREYIARNPMQRPLAEWTQRFHDEVNIRLGKKKHVKRNFDTLCCLVIACGLSLSVGYFVGKNARTCES